MASRDTRVHVTVIGVTLVLFAAVLALFPSFDQQSAILVAVGANALFHGGAHAYLLWRGEDGLVPVESRRRFVALVGIVTVLSAAGVLADTGETIAGIEVWTILVAIGVSSFLAYWILEARSGYQESRGSGA